MVEDTKGETLRGFVEDNVKVGDQRLPHQQAVKHSAKEYVRGDVHTNGIEFFSGLCSKEI